VRVPRGERRERETETALTADWVSRRGQVQTKPPHVHTFQLSRDSSTRTSNTCSPVPAPTEYTASFLTQRHVTAHRTHSSLPLSCVQPTAYTDRTMHSGTKKSEITARHAIECSDLNELMSESHSRCKLTCVMPYIAMPQELLYRPGRAGVHRTGHATKHPTCEHLREGGDIS
jgi:hypothetical protein